MVDKTSTYSGWKAARPELLRLAVFLFCPKLAEERVMIPQFRNLVFEGGGVKGLGYVGAIQVLAQRGLLQPMQGR